MRPTRQQVTSELHSIFEKKRKTDSFKTILLLYKIYAMRIGHFLGKSRLENSVKPWQQEGFRYFCIIYKMKMPRVTTLLESHT
jgi:hypothetical protein